MSGVHLHPALWPDDVVAGVIAGLIVAALLYALGCLVRSLFRSLMRRRAHAVERDMPPASASEERWLFGRGKMLRDELVRLPRDPETWPPDLVLRVSGFSEDARALYARRKTEVNPTLILPEKREPELLTTLLSHESLTEVVAVHLAAIRSVIHSASLPEYVQGDDGTTVDLRLTPNAA
jgi:hypothetical protein